MRLLSIFILCLLILPAFPAAAQFDANSLVNSDQGITLDPAFPQPGETVTATLTDYRGSSYGANLTWVLDGKVIPDAENQREVQVTAGKAGSEQNLQVVLTKNIGGKEVLNATINPVYLDIILEPQTRVPSFYRGRPLPSIGSVINATALVSKDSFLDPANLVYTWRLGQEVIGGGALRGQNKVSFDTPTSPTEILTVQVSKTDGTPVARRSILVISVRPEIHFYEVSALFGESHKVSDQGINIIGNSLVVRAEPYYLDSRVYNNPDLIEWTLNGLKTDNSNGGNPYEATLERLGTTGTVNLSFRVNDTSRQILQGAEGSTYVNF